MSLYLFFYAKCWGHKGCATLDGQEKNWDADDADWRGFYENICVNLLIGVIHVLILKVISVDGEKLKKLSKN